MNTAEIIQVLIDGAKADRLLPDTASPKPLKAINHGYVHDEADLRNQEHTFTRKQPSRNAVGLRDAALEIIALERNEDRRRALHAWVNSKVGLHTFKSWCAKEGKGISVEAGRRRAKRAIENIRAEFVRNDALNNGNNGLTPLIADRETGYKGITLVKPVWRDEEAQTARDCIVAGWRGMREARNAARRSR
jgi:hypothetical protein